MIFFIILIIHILDEYTMSILTIILYLHQNMGNTIHTYILEFIDIISKHFQKTNIFCTPHTKIRSNTSMICLCIVIFRGGYIIFGKRSKRSKICAEVGSCHRITIFGWQRMLFEFGFCIYLVILFIL